MTKQFIWKLSACACAVLLGACASNEANENLPLGTNASSLSRTGQSSNNTTFGGISVKRVSNAETQQVSELGKQTVLSGSDVDSVVVDGHAIDLRVDRTTANSSQYIYGRNSVSGYSYVNFGAYHTQKDNVNNAYALVHGQITPSSSMPTTGTATYTGHALINPMRNNVNALNVIWGRSSFDVNYGSKQITGDITTYANTKYPLSGTITGNSFSGTRDGIHMQGRFFGPNASELGGVFNSINNINGVMGSFGAQKDD